MTTDPNEAELVMKYIGFYPTRLARGANAAKFILTVENESSVFWMSKPDVEHNLTLELSDANKAELQTALKEYQ
jgi:hypothetical protein